MWLRLSAQDMENISEDDGWEFVNLGDQQSFGIKTAGLEEKATACQMLVSPTAEEAATARYCRDVSCSLTAAPVCCRCATPKS